LKSNTVALSSQQSKTASVTDQNLSKLLTGSPLRGLSDSDHRIGHLGTKDVAKSNKMTVEELDKFMHEMTDEKIVNDARKFVKCGS
jgi:hypothetical protein